MSSTALSADWPQFRGTGRDGKSSETGLLKVSPDDRVLSKNWTDGTLDCYHGGVIKLDGYIYGASDKNSRNN